MNVRRSTAIHASIATALSALLVAARAGAQDPAVAGDAATPATSSVAPAPPPRAYLDYDDGRFFLRAPLGADADALVLVPSGRAHIDTYVFAGPSVMHYQRTEQDARGRQLGTGLKANMTFRRFILELGGTIKDRWYFWIGGNFAPLQLDLNQNPTSSAGVYDGYVGYEADSLFRLQVGQFNAPFTMENVTSSRWLDFMERSLTARAVGWPLNKAIGVMAWGETSSRAFEYMIGAFGGEGQNRPSVDNRVDGMGRVVVRPMATSAHGAMKWLHVGGSVRYGRRDPDYVFYDAPTMTTPGGYPFWIPVYGKGATETHVIPADRQLAAGGEIYVPVERFDLKGEVVYLDEGRREAFINNLWETQRFGKLRGLSGYVQLSFWPLGNPRVNGHPGQYGTWKAPKHAHAAAPLPTGLQIALRGEMMRLRYDSNSGDTEVDKGFLDGSTNKISVNAYQAVVNYWATKHVRLTAQYSLYHFPGVGLPSIDRFGTFPNPPKPSTNQATAPGARASAFDFDANHFHEISFRVGLSL